MPTQELERTTLFQPRRSIDTNAVKSTISAVNAIERHPPVHHLLVCAQLCIAAEIVPPSLEAQIRQHTITGIIDAHSRMGTRDSGPLSPFHFLTNLNPLLNLNERICIDHYNG
jgi:hypothetical protein